MGRKYSMRIEGNSQTLYLEVGGSKFEVRTARIRSRLEVRNSRFENSGFEDTIQHCVKIAKMNVPVRNQRGFGNRIDKHGGEYRLG
jgi:hypothetical protein